MEAPVRILALNRRFLSKTTLSSSLIHCRYAKPSATCRYPNPNRLRLSFPFNANPRNRFSSNPPISRPNDDVFVWNRASRSVVVGGRGNDVVVGDKDCEVTVVLLGWLGAKTN